jgi:hypothetical protein
MGCLRSDGRERLLESFLGKDDGYDNVNTVPLGALAGDYAAVDNAWHDPHYGGSSDALQVFDLRTGQPVPNRGGQFLSCGEDYDYTCTIHVDQLVLGADTVSAAHASQRGDFAGCHCEEIVASDSIGTHTVDSASLTGSSQLTDLSLTGDTLTWNHSGAPRSAQLHP